MAAPAHRRGSDIYRRLLARPVIDDASGMAPVGVLPHADLGSSRRADHRRRYDLFWHRHDSRLDQTWRIVGIPYNVETTERGGLRRHHTRWPARPGNDRERR